MNIQNGGNQFRRQNQMQNGMQGQQMVNNYQTPMYGQVQSPPPATIPYITQQPRMQTFQNLSNGQPVQQQQVSSDIQGRFIDEPSQIDPREIPFDGTIAYYPTNDLSKIYAKAWDDQSNLMTVVYVPENTTTSTPSPSGSNDIWETVSERLDKMEATLQKFIDAAQKRLEQRDSRQSGKGGVSNGNQQ